MNWFKMAQNTTIAGEPMSPITSDVISTVQYALYFGETRAAITVTDMEVGEIVHLKVFPTHDKASNAYQETISKARL